MANSSLSKDYDMELTYEHAQVDPGLITRHAAKGKRKSYDGKVGNILPGNILVSSPNVTFLYKPTLMCRVRWRYALHFGPDDPLYVPQPFSRSVPHLALIMPPCFDTENKYHYAWTRLNEDHFVSDDTHSAAPNLGRLEPQFHHGLRALSKHVLNKVPSDTRDPFLLEGSANLYRLLDRLQILSSRQELFLRVACAQRQLIELEARLRFINEKWESRFRDAKLHRKAEDVIDVVGAFTEDLDDLDALYYAGVPVWFVREASRIPNPRIDEVADFIVEDDLQKLRLHRGELLDCMDTIPAQKVIFTGMPSNPDRYRKMALFLRAQFQFSIILGSPEPRFASALDPSRLDIGRSASEKNTSRRYNPRQKSIGNKQGNNTFLHPTNPLMPAPVPAWELALKRLSDYNQSLQMADGIQSGFWLPPARLIVSAFRKDTVHRLLVGWLKVRDVVLYQLGSPACKPFQLSVKQWRSMLELSEGGHFSSDPNTRTGKRNLEMRKLLEDSLANSPLSVDLGYLSTKRARWNSREVETSSDLPDNSITEILWELCELNFRNELVFMDSHLDISNMDRLDRQDLLEQCWVGSTNHADMAQCKGLGEFSAQTRLPYLHALQRVMQTWRGDRPPELLERLPDMNSHNLEYALQRFEKAIAIFYTSCFLDMFGRAASIPHR